MVHGAHRTPTGEDHRMPSSVYVIVEPGVLKPGEACRVTADDDGNILTLCAPGEIHPALVEDLNRAKVAIMNGGLWSLRPEAATPDILEPDRAEHLDIATARYTYAPLDSFLPGRLCACIEKPGSVTWFVPEGQHPDGHEYMTERFMGQINAYLRRIVGDGLLTQDRRGE
jgi:hypothetical protein